MPDNLPDVPDAPRPPVRSLSARETAVSVDNPDPVLFEGVPAHLLTPLQSWTASFLDAKLADRVAVTLRIAIDQADFAGALYSLSYATGSQLLDTIDVALQLDERLHYEIAAVGLEENTAAIIAHNSFVLPPWLFQEYRWPTSSTRARAVEELGQLLQDGGSAYQVHWGPPTSITRRVDPGVIDAFEHTLAKATPPAAELLRDAWRQTYGLRPNPTTAYRQAVRAVEQVACPLVLPNDEGATLGKVLSHLRQGGHKWRFVLVDRDGNDTVDPLVSMLNRLWTGQVSRHGGGKNSRDQTHAEADAAVHLAATAVQLLTTGALARRASS